MANDTKSPSVISPRTQSRLPITTTSIVWMQAVVSPTAQKSDSVLHRRTQSVGIFLILLFKPLALKIFAAKRTHHAHAGQILLRDRREHALRSRRRP